MSLSQWRWCSRRDKSYSDPSRDRTALPGRCSRALLAAVGLLAALSAPEVVLGKESADPVNRIFLVGDSAEWVSTRLKVEPGDHLNIRAGATVCFEAGEQESCVRAVGWPRETYAEVWPESAAECEDPYPEWNHAVLIGRVGEKVFEVGRSTVVEGEEGLLELSINDCSFEGEHRNEGQFSVVVVVENPTAYAAHGGRDLIEEAIDALGGKAIRNVGSLGVRAECESPGGSFTTEVYSIRPDQTLMRQTFDGQTSELLVIGDDAWSVDRYVGRRKKVSRKMRSMVLAHEFQLVFFELDTRFFHHSVAVAGDETNTTEEATEDDCLRIDMKDDYGSPAAVCLDPETKMPLRLSHQPPGAKKEPTIEIEVESWREINGVQYVEAFTLTQGDQTSEYRYDRIEPNSVGRGFFKQVSENSLKEIRKARKAAQREPGATATEQPEETEEGAEETPPPSEEEGGH